MHSCLPPCLYIPMLRTRLLVPVCCWNWTPSCKDKHALICCILLAGPLCPFIRPWWSQFGCMHLQQLFYMQCVPFPVHKLSIAINCASMCSFRSADYAPAMSGPKRDTKAADLRPDIVSWRAAPGHIPACLRQLCLCLSDDDARVSPDAHRMHDGQPCRSSCIAVLLTKSARHIMAP